MDTSVEFSEARFVDVTIYIRVAWSGDGYLGTFWSIDNSIQYKQRYIRVILVVELIPNQ
jgi:hypothetical protein